MIAAAGAEIVTIGTELLHGLARNTNAERIVERLAEIGVETIFQTTVGDETGRLGEALRAAVHRARFVVTTGGLGPTPDDLTRKAIATVFRRRLVLDEVVLAQIRARFRERGREMPAMNEAQALIPRGARVIENPRGTAPGLHFEHQGADVFVLPGVPAEAEAMMVAYVVPTIRSVHSIPLIARRVLRTIGLSESAVATELSGLEAAEPDVRIAYLPHSYGLDLTLSALAPDPIRMAEALDRVERRVIEVVGEALYGRDRETMSEAVGGLLAARGLTLATAESFTAGGIGAEVAATPGASRYFLGGIVAYANAAKEALLGVPAAVIEAHGAVSAETAAAMAKGARARFGADVALSSTGIAGPEGGTPEKPVGLVFLGLASAQGVETARHVLGGTRAEISIRSTAYALDLLRRRVGDAGR